MTGRPSKYTDEMVQAANHYLANYESYGDPVPTVAALACELGIHKDTCYEWAKHYDEFSDILTRIKQAQERQLVGGGLHGDFNPAVTKMMLTKHGYAERQEVSGPDGGPVKTQNTIDTSQLNNETLEELMQAKSDGDSTQTD